MTPSALLCDLAILERYDVQLVLTPDGALELDAPDDLQIWDEIVAAIHQHKRILLARLVRRETQTWPLSKHARWRSVANELETEAGMSVPEADVEAYLLLMSEALFSQVSA
jgi:hypothetical protein